MKKKKKQQSKLSENEFKTFVLTFFNKKRRFERDEAEFKTLKKSFNEMAEDYFQKNGIEDKISINYDCYDQSNETIRVTRVQRTKVIFDIHSMEMLLSKKAQKEVISKRYTVKDMNRLVNYLKECGVNPKIFKEFIEVEKTVNTEALDNLYELGKIDKEDLEKCYDIKKSEPYFKVSLEKK